MAPVVRLYLAYFKRLPDFEGLTFYKRYLAAGNTLQSISGTFAQSTEFYWTYGYLDNAAFVDLVYRNVLGRAPDAAGLAHWQGELEAQRVSRGDMMLAFSESAEFQSLTGSEVFVVMVYAGMLKRIPDAAGYEYWVGVTDSGDPGLGLISGFLDSAEYRARFVP
jgi:hypothetical protein